MLSFLEKLILLSNAESLVVTIMTDGCETVNDEAVLAKAIQTFKEHTKKLKKKLTIHTIGFTPKHDVQILNSLRESGNTGDGIFRYANTTDVLVSLNHFFYLKH